MELSSPIVTKRNGYRDQSISTLGQLSRIFALLGLLLSPLAAEAQSGTGPSENAHSALCPMIEAVARDNVLPVDFFTRLIWRESHLQPDAVGPITASGERAEGIAQFMPYTAEEQHLGEPFDSTEALKKSGKFLASLQQEFGNLGLAAAAYNAGPQRVRDFVAGLRDLPLETQNYVRAITGRAIEEWKETAAKNSGDALPAATGVAVNCHDLVAALKAVPDRTDSSARELRVPGWCQGLRHPNVHICGPVHLGGATMTPASRVNPNGHAPLLKASFR